MASTSPPKRRFVPVPIETTYQSSRKGVQLGANTVRPNPELTPEQSPQSPRSPRSPRSIQFDRCPSLPSPHLRQDRRFKPQLIETSRRARRVGDPGPATRPTDKTDITPYTNHIYMTKSRTRRKNGDGVEDEPSRPMPPTRRETEDEVVKEYLLEIAAKEAARQMEEVALAAFPNSRAREGGVAHFYFRESSDSDNPTEDTPQIAINGNKTWNRRKSSDLGLNWWQKHMQTHAEQLAHERGEDAMEIDYEEGDTLMRTDSDLDKMDLAMPPDPLWTTTKKMTQDDRMDSLAGLPEIRSSRLSLTRLDSGSRTYNRFHTGDSVFGPEGNDQVDGASSPTSQPAADRGFGGGFGRPFGAFGFKLDPKLHLERQIVSPPMLGKDLVFRRCPSPKLTKLETDHPFLEHDAQKEQNRDMTGDGGLWRGYCCRSESNSDLVVPAELHGANMLITPHPPGSPQHAAADSPMMSEEPELMFSSSNSSESVGLWSPAKAEQPRPRNGYPTKGLHLLHGLDERLRREKAQVELDEKIAAEFDDEFVTQVYNYLSLGYPAMARSFDPELSKISGFSIEDLTREDEKQMAKGHMLEMNLQDTSEEGRCWRWKALRIYIYEWARQHPDLDNLDPLAWGVRERRGSWAI